MSTWKVATNICVPETAPNKMNLKKHIQRHIIIKMAKVKDKDRILKAARERQLPARKPP